MTKTVFFIHDDVNLVQFVIPGLTRNPVFSWIPTPHFRGDKFTPAKAGAGMTCSVEINDAVYEFRILVIGIYLTFEL
jgi:hypothetical protein